MRTYLLDRLYSLTLFIVCFHLFDQDQLGLVQDVDLKSLMNLLHNVDTTRDKVRGNVRSAWGQMRFAKDDKVDFNELANHHAKFPLVFQPAFKLHRDMQTAFFGSWFWDAKKERLAQRRVEDLKESPEGMEQRRLDLKKERKARKGIKRNMGMIRYYFCPCFRSFYKDPEEPSPPEPVVDRTALQKLREEEYKRLKNPDTIANLEYQKVVNQNPEYIATKLHGGEKNRRNRAEDRQERKKRRKENLDRNFLS